MKEFVEKLMNWLANHHRVVKTDEDVEWNRAIYSCEEEVKRLAEEYKEQNIDQDLMIVASLPSLYPMMQPFEVEAIHRVASSAKYSGGWIPCSERLPEENEEVILTFKNSAGLHVGEATYKNKIFFYVTDTEFGYYEEVYKNPIAWKPKDAHYQPKGE